MALKASDINRFAVTGALYLKVMTRKKPLTISFIVLYRKIAERTGGNPMTYDREAIQHLKYKYDSKDHTLLFFFNI